MYAAGFRGAFRVALQPPRHPVFLADWDATLPDLVPQAAAEVHQRTRWAGSWSMNATDSPGRRRSASAHASTSARIGSRRLPALAASRPLGHVLKIPRLASRAPTHAGRQGEPRLEVGCSAAEADLRRSCHQQAFRCPCGDHPDGLPPHVRLRDRRTRCSSTACGPAQGEPAEGAEPGVVLTLHGAGVDAWARPTAYAPQPGLVDRRADEPPPVRLRLAGLGPARRVRGARRRAGLDGVDRRRVYLTGHSMGGHGTWHLAANDPDRFAAVAPSAGWATFDTYGGRPEGPLARAVARGRRASHTRALIANLATCRSTCCTATDDDNVPVRRGAKRWSAC